MVDIQCVGDASWVELDVGAFENNVTFFQSAIARHGSRSQLGCVLKGNAYGHGIDEMARLAAQSPALSVLYVFSYAEALRVLPLKRADQRILVLGAHPDHLLSLPSARAMEWVLSSRSQVQQLLRQESQEGEPLNLHVHFDSGLGREGFLKGQWESDLVSLLAAGSTTIRGCMTHFANTEDVTRQDYARQQIRNFEAMSEELGEFLSARGLPRPERHLAASAATLVLPASLADVVRVGIGIYGLWPSNETRLSFAMTSEGAGDAKEKAPGSRPANLRPVLSWRVRSQCIKKLDPGQFVGYGCTYRCDRETTIAVFPVGYADGYARHLTSHAHVLIEGRRCPVIGRVMMNHIIVAVAPLVDLSGKETVVATLIGRDGDEEISADDIASWSGTISYEAVTRIGPGIQRVLIAADSRL